MTLYDLADCGLCMYYANVHSHLCTLRVVDCLTKLLDTGCAAVAAPAATCQWTDSRKKHACPNQMHTYSNSTDTCMTVKKHCTHMEHSQRTHQKGGLSIVQPNVCPSEAALKTSCVTASLQADMLLWQIKLTWWIGRIRLEHQWNHFWTQS